MRKFDDNIVCTQKQNEIHAPILHVMHLFCCKVKERERYYIVCKNIIKIYCPDNFGWGYC